MAAPLRKICQRTNAKSLTKDCLFGKPRLTPSKKVCFPNIARYFGNASSSVSTSKWKVAAATCVACVSGYALLKSIKEVKTESALQRRSDGLLVKSVPGALDLKDQRLTLYQFHSCPYCCKVRAALDYYGFPYDLVEVNSVTKKQVKFSEYKKVPILVLEGKDKDGPYFVQFYDSSLIVSALASYVIDPSTSLKQLHTYFPAMKDKEGSKTVWTFPNKYFIMYGETDVSKRQHMDLNSSSNAVESDSLGAERKWRKWTDDILMHTISPNVYRTMSESYEAFQHFSEWGQWDKNFSTLERLTIVYFGTFAMYFVARLVSKKYKIKPNPRESLYEACDEWMQAVGKNQFLGINKPNLADLAVYGALHSFEGCLAHEELMKRHKVADWYHRMEEQINNHQGAALITEKPLNSH